MIDSDSNAVLIDAVGERTRRIVESLRGLSDDELHQPSELPGWSRLTIACHLRYGAQALGRMTSSALEGQPVAYYPEGRDVQRPRTLVPLAGESPLAVVESLARSSEELQHSWSALDPGAWSVDVVEPPQARDLGPVPLGRLPLLRSTEVEVHGTDLGMGLDDWSTLFVMTVLPMRLEWLNTRRANHRAFDAELEGSWLIVATDGPTYRVSCERAPGCVHTCPPRLPGACHDEATSRDLLALLLGRAFHEPPVITGDVAFGGSFPQAFPGP